ncbi:acyl-CoA dehydrogenase family protein [Paenibacillus sp. sptzw28]|uniref:acyl-CoA dehydrogenase family protein n=1 Tax=Paenibacillus sp. sptzw28 TaxID=715179 RepID=UPI001C6E1EC5|nr:acyl-CoA dehydrogenase family protein [Paenibacillus sp. sptzw28]QYR20944.1 acyl-CoA dehydrogenase family protein [Paenibacillus sp. sptzw28]
MQFRFSEELEMTRALIRDFAAEEVAWEAGERDEEERFDRRLFDLMGDLGLTGIPWPERYGGSGSDCLTYAVVIEELSRVCASTGAVLAAHTALSSWPIYAFGSGEFKEKYLKGLANGTKLGASSLEPGITGYEDGDDCVLNGSNRYVANAGEADTYVVIARNAPEQGRRKRGYNAVIVEKGAPGFNVGVRARKLGLRSLAVSEITFENCRVPLDNRLGKAGQGQEIAGSVMELARISAAAQAVGIAQGALDAAAKYAGDRKQFGKPIGRQQGISFKLADMAARLEASRLLAYQAAWRHSAGLPCRKEAALAGKFAADTAVAVTIEAVQVFGGYGYMREYTVERYMRDAKCIEMGIGSGKLNKDSLIRSMIAD